MSAVDIIIPTFNSPEYLHSCVTSIIRYTMPDDLSHIFIVNNGDPEHMGPYKGNPRITVLQQSRNLGWEGGLKAGLAASESPYVLFMNDDTFIPSFQRLWLSQLLQQLIYPNIAAVGPTSNVVMGRQNIFDPLAESVYRTKFLIGFCMLLKREMLEAAGGIDDTLPGGDDLDLSIRLRKLGKFLVINREVFVWHHGFKTGQKVHGSDWNSVDMIERVNHALIVKHGLHEFLDLWKTEPTPEIPFAKTDTEGDMCRKYVDGGKVLELGCGDQKTVPDSLGIDIVPKGGSIPGLSIGRFSVADRIGDVQEKLPVDDGSFDTVIARHVLEHMTDTVQALQHWGNALKHGGKLIVAVPNQQIRNTIPLNYQHVHAYTPDSLKRLMESLGWKTEAIEDSQNNISFVGVFRKNGVH